MVINETVVYLMVVAIGIGAVALAAQAVAVVLVARQVKLIREHLDRLSPKAEAVLATADETVKESRERIQSITAKADEILSTAKDQVKRTDEFLTEATTRARVQLDRVELVLDDTITRVHKTVVLVNSGVTRPVQQVTGLVAGVRAAIDHLLGARRPNVSQATTDEEMFI